MTSAVPTEKALQVLADAARPYSTEVQAREGLDNASTMTPLRVSQAIETLAGQGFLPANQGNDARIYATVTGMTALEVPQGITAITVDGYYAAGDGGAALYKKVETEPDHGGKFQTMDGAWWEISVPVIRPEMLGAIGTDEQNQAILDATMRYANAFGVPLEIVSDIGVAGVAETRSDLIIDFKNGGKLRQTDNSVVGAFLTNVTRASADRAQSDITIRNPSIDGDGYLYQEQARIDALNRHRPGIIERR